MIYNLFNVYKSKYDKTSLEKFIFKLNSRTPLSLFFRQNLCSLRNSSINIYFHMYFFSRINTNWKILKTLVPIVQWDVYKIPFKQSSPSHGKFEFINSVTHASLGNTPLPREKILGAAGGHMCIVISFSTFVIRYMKLIKKNSLWKLWLVLVCKCSFDNLFSIIQRSR